jgi:tetratricopeptide (TPR) repeat protein
MHGSGHSIFISFHDANADGAHALAGMLRSHGLTVRCEPPNVGTAQPERLAALLQAKLCIFWLSADHCRDAQLQRELLRAFAASHRHEPGERIVVVDDLEDDARLPATLAARCERWRATDLGERISQLANRATRLQTSLGTPSNEESSEATEIAPRIGQLWALHETLWSCKDGRPMQLVGEAGCGKTWLANEYARWFRDAYPGGVYRLDAGWIENPNESDRRSLRALAWNDVAASLGIDAASTELDSAVPARLTALQAPYLWIVDSLPAEASPEELRIWNAPTAGGRTLFISRAVHGALGPQLHLGPFDAEEARVLLERHRPMATPPEAMSGRTVIEQLGAHPLAVRLAAKRIARSTYDRMLLQLAAPSREAAQIADGLAATLRHPQLVGIAVSIHRTIARLSGQGRQALRLASVLAPAAVPHALLTTALAQLPRSAARHTVVSDTDFAIQELVDFGLAHSATEDSVSIVPLVREAMLACESTTDLEISRNLLVAILAGELPQSPEASRDNPYWRWLPHVLHLARTAEPGPQAVEINAWLARFEAMLGSLRADNRRAVALLERGDVDGAQQLLDMEVSARRQGLGEDHPQTATPVNNLGVALTLRGDFAQARNLFERAIELRRKALGDTHVDLLTPLNNLGVVLWHEGEHANARKLFEKVVELRRHLLGERHPDTLVAMRNLAVALRHDGDYVAARGLLEHVVKVRGESLGNQHIDTCTAMASLAETLREHSEAIFAKVSDALEQPILVHGATRTARA